MKSSFEFNSTHHETYLMYKTVVLFYEDQLSQAKIAEQVGKSKSAVRVVLDKFKQFANVHYIHEYPERQKIFDDSELASFIRETIKKNNKINQNELVELCKSNLKINVSQSTISRYLQTIGSYQKPFEVPIMSEKNRLKRIDYALYHEKDKFTNVIFTDESQCTLFRNTGKVFRIKGDEAQRIEKPNPNYSIIVWGAISMKCIVGFWFVEGKINKEFYINILQNNLIDNANKLYGRNKWRFQQDNAPAHNSYLVREWLAHNVNTVLNHPPQSPDLNPIEMVWAIMKNKIEKQSPKNLNELKIAILNAWQSIDNSTITRCIEKHKKVVQYVLENEGKIFK